MNQHQSTQRSRCKIVAVDGPAGSGKSTICASACKSLGWTYVNTGFLYRAIAFICRKRNLDLQNDQNLSIVINEFSEHLIWHAETGQVIFNGDDLSPDLYTDRAGIDASFVAKNPLVRQLLLPLQRRLTLQSPLGAIVDGRDIGTAVFPDADLKIFMTASLEERARRRLLQLHDGDKKQITSDQLQVIKESISQRDEQDAARGASPLKQAEDAILFDTSYLDAKEAQENLIALIRNHALIEA